MKNKPTRASYLCPNQETVVCERCEKEGTLNDIGLCRVCMLVVFEVLNPPQRSKVAYARELARRKAKKKEKAERALRLKKFKERQESQKTAKSKEAICSYCDQLHSLADINGYGICSECEHAIVTRLDMNPMNSWRPQVELISATARRRSQQAAVRHFVDMLDVDPRRVYPNRADRSPVVVRKPSSMAELLNSAKRADRTIWWKVEAAIQLRLSEIRIQS